MIAIAVLIALVLALVVIAVAVVCRGRSREMSDVGLRGQIEAENSKLSDDELTRRLLDDR